MYSATRGEPGPMQAELASLEKLAEEKKAELAEEQHARLDVQRRISLPLATCTLSSLHDTLLASAKVSDDALLGSALTRLAEAVDAAESHDVGTLSGTARDSGALLLICSSVEHDDLRIHQASLALLANFTTAAVDPLGCEATKSAFKTIAGGFAHVVAHLFSEHVLTVALTCAIIQNVCAEKEHCATLSQTGGVAMSARDAALEEVEKEEEKTKRLAARKGARKTHRMAALHPLVTSRPKPQRWVKRADDWKREAEQACLEAHHVWGEVPKEAQKIAAAGLPPRPYAQVKSKVQGGALSEQERAYQLESLLANRERKRLAAVKARVKEARANEQYDENRRRLEWYHTQREKAATPMRPDERKVAQERLAALPDRPVKGAVYG